VLCVALQVDDKGKVYIGFMLHIQEATNYDSEEEQEPMGPLKSDTLLPNQHSQMILFHLRCSS